MRSRYKEHSADLRHLLIAVLVLLTGCEKNESSYFPLQAGPVWQYNIDKYTVIGLSKQKLRIQNFGEHSEAGSTSFVRLSINGIESHYSQNDNGIRLAYNLAADSKAQLPQPGASVIFAYPLQVGKQWQDNITTVTLKSFDQHANDIVESIPVDVRIASVNDTVRVAAGKYKRCLRLEAVGEKHIGKARYAYQDAMTIKLKNTRWYAAGVGLIKEVQTESTGILQYPDGSFSKTLEKFY